MQQQSGPLDVATLVDEQPIGRLQFGVFALCAACLFLEGVDTQAISYAAPAIIKAWQVPAPSFGPVFSAGLLGLLLGVLGVGTLSDYLGRRYLAITCVAVFGLATLATVAMRDVTELLVLRLITGCALGGNIPMSYALAAEFSPARHRYVVVLMMGLGLPLGLTAAGPLAAQVVPQFGWPAIFYLGGVLPLLLAVLLAWRLPESIRFLAIRPGNRERIARLLARMYPGLGLGADAEFTATEDSRAGLTVKHLFTEGRLARTLLAWTMVAMNMLTYYGLLSWLPTVITQSGLSYERAAITSSLFTLGGIFAALTVGWIADRFNAYAVLGCLYLMGGLFAVLIGQTYTSPGLLLVIVACAGFGLIGGQNTSNPVVLGLYPTFLRATGFGWWNAVGRIGSVLGPLLGALMLSLHFSLPRLFMACALPASCAALAAFALIPLMRNQPQTAAAAGLKG